MSPTTKKLNFFSQNYLIGLERLSPDILSKRHSGAVIVMSSFLSLISFLTRFFKITILSTFAVFSISKEVGYHNFSHMHGMQRNPNCVLLGFFQSIVFGSFWNPTEHFRVRHLLGMWLYFGKPTSLKYLESGKTIVAIERDFYQSLPLQARLPIF